jgi:hypothetical protein
LNAGRLAGQRADSTKSGHIVPPRIVGVVYDSISGRALAGAWVTVGASISTTTDSGGRFVIDSAPVGRLRVAAQHPAIDSLGLNAIVAEVPAIAGVEVTVSMATPSRQSLWRAACPGLAPPVRADTGLVHGIIRSADARRPIVGATVRAIWFDTRFVAGAPIRVEGWEAEGTSDATGTYTVCGVPSDAVIRLRAALDGDSTAALDVDLGGRFVVRRDLVLAPAAARTGIIAGTVLDAAGAPREGARIILDDVPEVRTDAVGRFLLRGAPLGSRQLHVLAVGFAPVVVPVDILARDTATVRVTVERVTLLSTVHIEQSRMGARLQREFEYRQKAGMGYFVDSTRIATMASVVGVLNDVPGVHVPAKRDNEISILLKNPHPPPAECAANVLIDGIRADAEMLSVYRKDDLAAIEVYPRAGFVPARYLPSRTTCGSVLVWTKWAFR